MGKTSPEAVKRYKAKVYKQFKVELKKELIEKLEAKLAEAGMTKAEFVRRAIQDYLGENVSQ